jgi:uncharacterized protein YfbU (UPF0304 family)
LQSVLIGKVHEIYTQLSIEQCADYDAAKEVILKGYELGSEAYRQKFSNCERVRDQTHVAVVKIKEQLFNRWRLSRKVEKHYDYLRQLIIYAS